MNVKQLDFGWSTEIINSIEKQELLVVSHITKNISSNVDKDFLEEAKKLFSRLDCKPLDEKIETLNEIKIILHSHSPFSKEPVDCVLWIPTEIITANDYNPNTVAPPEMKLLERSIKEDGYTQPIVAWKKENNFEVVDGFHRNRVGRESKIVNERIMGYLPITIINSEREDRGDRISATIRHNRARGKHNVEGMSDIVVELKRRNWTNERIAENLGMDEDEILRLCQITGLADLFSDQEFSKSWDIDDSEPDFVPLEDDFELAETDKFRTINTNDGNRIFHTHEKWECHKAGFYATTKEGMTRDQCEQAYKEFLSDIPKFSEALEKVISEWKYSCEHYLTNVAMNRIAWLGQASACYALRIPATYRGGFYLLSNEQQRVANETALIFLNKWLERNGREAVTMEEALSDNQMDLY